MNPVPNPNQNQHYNNTRHSSNLATLNGRFASRLYNINQNSIKNTSQQVRAYVDDYDANGPQGDRPSWMSTLCSCDCPANADSTRRFARLRLDICHENPNRSRWFLVCELRDHPHDPLHPTQVECNFFSSLIWNDTVIVVAPHQTNVNINGIVMTPQR